MDPDNGETFDVVIVGAGFAGLYLLVQMRRLGLRAIVLEAGAGVGGTWYWNRYPGARCDVESAQYSFQFDEALQQDWTWSERYAAQPEILRYAEHMAARFDLLRDIRFNVQVSTAVFDENKRYWQVSDSDGKAVRGRFCILATGSLSKPNVPDIPGLSEFRGQILNTATWPHEPVSFAGQRVGVLGTGSSGIQVIPHLAAEADTLFVMQRTPNYSVPARNRPLGQAETAKIKAEYPALRRRAKARLTLIDGHYGTQNAVDVTPEARTAAYEAAWAEGGLLFMARFTDGMLSRTANDIAADFVRGKIRETVVDKEVAECLCPTNVIGAKRICVDTGYYETFNRSNVHLLDVRTHPIERFVPEGVVIEGRTIALDAMVFATGFDAMTGALTTIDLYNTHNVTLRDLWREGPSTYLGFGMAGFPNLFVVNGPGSPSVLSNMLAAIEQQTEWIAACLAHIAETGATRIEVIKAAEEKWWSHCQELGAVGLKSSADSWYLGANIEGKARVFLPYLGGYPAYAEHCETEAASGYSAFDIR